jgi:multiple sugar transport system substrate-binding protein
MTVQLGKGLTGPKTRRWMMGTGLAGGASLALAACGAAGEGTGASKASSAPATVTFHWIGASEQEMVEKRTPVFLQEHPNIKVNLEPYGGDDKLMTLASSGTLGDVSTLSASSGLPAVLYVRKVMAALDPFITRDKLDLKQWFAPVIEASRVEGKQIAMPYNGKMARVAVFYNKSMFDKAGIKYPDEKWTVDQYMDAAVKMTKGEGSEKEWGMATHFKTDQSYVIAFLRRWNADLFDKAGKKATLESQEARAAFQWAWDMYHNKRVAPTTGDETKLFQSGKGAIMLHRDFNQKNATTTAAKTQGFEYGASFGPKGPTGRWGGLWTYRAAQLSVASKAKDAAWELIKFMCDKESGVSLALQTAPGTSTTGGARADVYGDPRLLSHPSAPRQVQEAERDSQNSTEPYTLPANFRVDEISNAINPFIDKIVKNEAQPTAGFMKEANDAVQRVLDLPREGG